MPATTGITCNAGLFVATLSTSYGPAEEAALVDELARRERTTQVKYVAAARDLELGPTGALADGYRFTELAFKQVCALAGRGLYPLVLDLSGAHRGPDDPRDDYSFAHAAALYNDLVRRRFAHRFAGKVRMVRDSDPRRRLVDGVLGPKYHYLENRMLYELARDATGTAPRKVRFHEAVLAGRRFLLRYVHERPLLVRPDGGEAFHGGYHFSNAEIAGQASAQAATLVVRHPGGLASLGRPAGGRLPHTGKLFRAKLKRMFQAALAASQDAPALRARLDRLRDTPLGLGGTEAERAAQLDYLAVLLHRQSVPRSLAQRIAVAAMTYGTYDRVARPLPLSREVLAARTAYDLYHALTREAMGLPLAAREAVERAADGLLWGTFKLKA